MKEKRRISADGYFEVSTDGKRWTKTTERPTPKEIAEYKSYKAGANPNYNKSTTSTGLASKVAKPKTAIEEKFAFENMTPKEVTLPVAQGSDLSQFDPNSVSVEDKVDPKTGMFTSKVSESGTYGLPQANANGKMNWGDAAGMGLSALQSGYGLQQLMKDKRPIDKLDPAYNQLTDQAIADSRFGYTPEQKSMLQHLRCLGLTS